MICLTQILTLVCFDLLTNNIAQPIIWPKTFSRLDIFWIHKTNMSVLIAFKFKIMHKSPLSNNGFPLHCQSCNVRGTDITLYGGSSYTTRKSRNNTDSC